MVQEEVCKVHGMGEPCVGKWLDTSTDLWMCQKQGSFPGKDTDKPSPSSHIETWWVPRVLSQPADWDLAFLQCLDVTHHANIIRPP